MQSLARECKKFFWCGSDKADSDAIRREDAERPLISRIHKIVGGVEDCVPYGIKIVELDKRI